jgi:hypothetical protein
MSSTIDCPICLMSIDLNGKNFIKTECGHDFHASCLLHNVISNGFSCPCCRAVMATKNNSAISSLNYNSLSCIFCNSSITLRGCRYCFRCICGETRMYSLDRHAVVNLERERNFTCEWFDRNCCEFCSQYTTMQTSYAQERRPSTCSRCGVEGHNIRTCTIQT